MHVLVAASVSGSFAFLSHFPSSSSDNASQNALPLTSLNLSNCWTKRPTLLSPAKVSVSSGSTTQTDDGVDQSSFTDDYRQTRVWFCVCVILNFSFSMLPWIVLCLLMLSVWRNDFMNKWVKIAFLSVLNSLNMWSICVWCDFGDVGFSISWQEWRK